MLDTTTNETILDSLLVALGNGLDRETVYAIAEGLGLYALLEEAEYNAEYLSDPLV